MGKYSARTRRTSIPKKPIKPPEAIKPDAPIPKSGRRGVLSLVAGVMVASIVLVTVLGRASYLWEPSLPAGYQYGYRNMPSYPGDTDRVMQTWQLSRNSQFAQALAESQAIVADPDASKEERDTAEVDVSYNAWRLGQSQLSSKSLADFDKESTGLHIDPGTLTEAKGMRERLLRGPSTKYYNDISGHNWLGMSSALRNPSFTSKLMAWRKALNAIGGDLYTTGVDPAGYAPNMPSAYLKSATAGASDWDGLLQMIAADSYRGKRVQFTAYFKTDSLATDAYLWVRVETPKGNFYARIPYGTPAWQRQAIVLDVPEDAQGILLGETLVGPGKASLAEVHLDVVGNDIPVTPPDTNF
ncbi:MAG TPA: hypothetical protein VFW40_07040 [Capsulimonadaceae bacterium]|nr:hypothetical protein [Capsulimonadaceae bacterium]